MVQVFGAGQSADWQTFVSLYSVMELHNLVSPVVTRQRPIILTSALLTTLLVILLLVACSASDGKDGNDGVDGPQGLQGAQGLKGDTGPQSPAGAAGKDGVAGVAGDSGAQGPTGKDGVAGVAGDSGAQGPTGKDGVDGVAGAAGAAIVRNIPAGNVLTPLDSIKSTYTSTTIGADGLGLISYSYWDGTNTDMKVAHCENAFCSPYFRRR